VLAHDALLAHASTEHRPLGTERDQLREPRGAKRPQRRDDEDRLEQVRLALTIVTDEDVEALARREGRRNQVANVLGEQRLDPQI
jgi:hypothetical protein